VNIARVGRASQKAKGKCQRSNCPDAGSLPKPDGLGAEAAERKILAETTMMHACGTDCLLGDICPAIRVHLWFSPSVSSLSWQVSVPGWAGLPAAATGDFSLDNREGGVYYFTTFGLLFRSGRTGIEFKPKGVLR
jgi:hypothetical protein